MSDRIRTDILAIQTIVATASPGAWRDGLVVSRQPGELTIVLLDDQLITLSTLATPEPGEPVAVHPIAGVVAVGDRWTSARPLDELAR